MYFVDETSKYAYPTDLEVLSLDRSSLEPLFKRVANISRHKAPLIAEIDFNGGSVTTTLDHSVMVVDEEGEIVERAVRTLRRGDLLMTFNSEMESNSTEVRAPEFQSSKGRGVPMDPATGLALKAVSLDQAGSWVLGSYMAEGCASIPAGKGGTTVLTYGYPQESSLAERAAAYFGGTMGLHTHTHTVVSGSSGRKSGIQLTICSKPLARFFANHFYSQSAPSLVARFKRVPDFILNAPPELRREFMKGYAGDASGEWQNLLRYKSASRMSLVGTSWLGRVTGLHTSVFERETRVVWNRPKLSYFVGELVPAKPFVRFLERLGKRVGFNWRYEMRHQLYYKKSAMVSRKHVLSLLRRANGSNLTSSERISLVRLRRLASSELYATQITGIKVKSYAGFVYDLCVPGSQVFWGGTSPVLLHNSDERGIDTVRENNSDERGIDTVREKVKVFARFVDRREGIPFRLVILDESDEMTRDSQNALRRIMEESSRYTRFVLVCNYSSGIIEAIQSRCAIFRFQRLDSAAIRSHLESIAEKEKVEAESGEAFDAICEGTQGDLRQAINMLQAASASGRLTLDSVKSVTGTTVRSRVGEIIALALDGNFEGSRTKMVELTRVYGIPERDFLRFANEAVHVESRGPREGRFNPRRVRLPPRRRRPARAPADSHARPALNVEEEGRVERTSPSPEASGTSSPRNSRSRQESRGSSRRSPGSSTSR
ncbi:MAG: hypothetical protein HY297_01120 [Thaumarchaeota archaeon]|nr:hypothetical protein [Nitrososphaerota archaeon]